MANSIEDSRRLLPSLLTEGSYSPRTLVIELPEIDTRDLLSSFLLNTEHGTIQTFVHEMNHWYDFIGSVWGQRYLDLLFSAYDQLNFHAPHLSDASYPSSLKLFDFERSSLFPIYFKYADDFSGSEQLVDTKTLQFTTGCTFDPTGERREDNPYLFLRVQSSTGNWFRLPITSGSLLELRARNAEYECFEHWLARFPDDEAKVWKFRFDRDEKGAKTLDGNLLTYTGGYHILNAAFPNLGFFETWKNAAILADLCLNLTPAMFRRYNLPHVWNISPITEHGFIKNESVGFAYATLVQWISRTLGNLSPEAMDLGNMMLWAVQGRTEVYDAAIDFVGGTSREALGTGHLARIRAKLREAGLQILRLKSTNMGSITLNQMPDLPSPRIMTSDLELHQFGQRILSDEDFQALEDYQYRLDDNIRNALRAARGLDFSFTDYSY